MADKKVQPIKKAQTKAQSIKKETKPENAVPSFKSPTETLWGKIIIWALIVGTVGLIFFSLIFAIINM